MDLIPTDKNRSSRLWRWRLAVIGGALVIFIGSSIPSSSMPSLRVLTQDKLLHMLEYGAFGLLLCSWARREFSRPRRVMAVLVLAALYGISDEAHQYLVGRSCEFYDWLADMVGVSLAILFSSLYYRWRNKNVEQKRD
jgi:VanZ family protein